MNEQKINAFFDDGQPKGLGTGWWAGVLATFFGVLGLGGVVCLHFPQWLSSPELRAHYSLPVIRMTLEATILAALVMGAVSAMLRKKKALAATGVVLAIAALAFGGWSVPIDQPLKDGPAIGLD